LNKALIISGAQSFRNTEMIALLSRSDFQIDFLSCNFFHFLYRGFNNFFYVKKYSDIPRLASRHASKYDLIVLMGDFEIKLIKDSHLTIRQKVKLLPIKSFAHIKHLCSKVELAKIFIKKKISSPIFRVIKNHKDIAKFANELGCPVIIKIDYSGGGAGVFKLNHTEDIKNIPKHFEGELLIMQKFIEGKLLDFSGFYQDGKLIHFSSSEFIGGAKDPFGPSMLKKYFKPYKNNDNLFIELSGIGKALGLHGFTNLGCIESDQDGKRYYFEVDVRPNDWINYAKYLGDDPAIQIKNYFDNGGYVMKPYKNKRGQNTEFILANPSRLNFFDLAMNKYNWMSYSSLYGVFMDKLSHLFFSPIEKLKYYAVIIIKPHISEHSWMNLKKIFKNLFE